MPSYQWAVKKGEIIDSDYDRSMALNGVQVENEIRNAFDSLFDGVTVSFAEENFNEVYKVTIPKGSKVVTVYICAKGTTPGGRSNLKDEQRIQQKAKYFNYVFDKRKAGEKAISLGVYRHDSETIFCAWNVARSSATPETPISKQIKIATIARALSEGFVQQMTGSGEYVCAFKKEFIYFYLSNCEWIHKDAIEHLNDHNTDLVEPQEEIREKDRKQQGENLLFYGVPGAGKSHEIDSRIEQEYSERVVFHPDYTYSDFVGQILPRLIKTDAEPESEAKLRYVFHPGPFTRILGKAYQNPENMYYLVIEEINRGNAPAIFGDIFQLLDRDEKGTSRYQISNYDMGNEIYKDENHPIRIPSNLTLMATMNTSDQNVFTLDTAFQRRWEMHLILNRVKEAKHADQRIEGTRVTWGDFAFVTNEEILRFGEEIGGSEDKRLGAYFAGEGELTRDKFPEKVLKYLWDDVFKMDHSAFFRSEIRCFDTVIGIFQETPAPERDFLKQVLNLSVYQRMVADLPEGITEDEG